MKPSQEDMANPILAWDATPDRYLLCKSGWWKIEAMTRVSEDWLVVVLIDQEGESFSVNMLVEDLQQTVDRLEERRANTDVEGRK